MLEIEELRSRFLDQEFDAKNFRLSADALLTVARASGETLPEFVDRSHPEFQASPAFLGSLASGRTLPVDFPSLNGITMDGGKAVTCVKPVPAEVPLTGRTHLHDIYEKKGRSGRMVFIVSRMQVFDEGGEHLATSDSRMVIREVPAQ